MAFPRIIPSVLSILLASAAVVAPAVAGAADPYVIETVLPLTGPAAFLGREESQALSILETMVNKDGGIGGRDLQFHIQDDQSSPQVGVELTNAIVAKHPAVMIGSSLVAICNAMAPLLKTGPVDYCLSPGVHPAEGSYVFSSSISTDALLQASARYFHDRGWRSIAIITSTDATGQDAERTIDAAFGDQGKYGEKIVLREHFNTTDLSVDAQMARIKAAQPQAVIAWATGTPVATLLRGAQDVGLAVPVEIGNGNLTYAQMKAYRSFLPRQLYFAAPPAIAPERLPAGAVSDAVHAYLAAFAGSGTKPDIGQSLAWDPVQLMVAALRHLGPDATAEQVRAYIASLKDWSGINGTYNFSTIAQRGVGENSVVMVRWSGSKDRWLPVSALGGAALR